MCIRDSAATLQATRAWSDDEWAAGVEAMARRGVVDTDGAMTDEGRTLRQHVEDRTDALAAPAWAAIDETTADEVRSLVRPHSKTIAATAFA